MVLIISENKDIFTTNVIEWLHFYGIYDIVRINEDDMVRIDKIEVHKNVLVLSVNGRLIHWSDVNLFWYRRGNLNHPFRRLIDFYPEEISQQTQFFLNHEWAMCHNYIVYMLQQKKTIGNFFRTTANKLINLKIAQECGLDTPQTLISDSPETLKKFGQQPSITKPIGEIIPISKDDGYYSLLTKEFDADRDLNYSQKYVFPSLLQENIEKEIEIRTFVLFDAIYSMASFSQRSEETRTDLRRYDLDRLNRVIPYKLPKDIEKKILLFMQKSKLNTGSIDFIKTKDNRYVFLEVNPAGNINMVSDNCNYHIEKKIAEIIKKEILIEYDL